MTKDSTPQASLSPVSHAPGAARRVSRRHLLQAGGLATAAAAAVATGTARAAAPLAPTPAASNSASSGATALRFNSDGRFKIVQFNDTQDDHLTDRRTIEFMGKVLDQEKPDFALINGDVITGGPETAEQVYQAINNVVLPMESRAIPWAITFGNHDEDSLEESNTGVREHHMADFVRQYRHNHNPTAPADRDYGHSDAQLLVASAKDPSRAGFAIWLLDSGNYISENGAKASESLSGQAAKDLPDYDVIRPQQIHWYRELSQATEDRFGAKVPGLMFFHIPTYEHRDLWFGGPANTSADKHREAAKNHGIDGVKNEDVYFGAFNSGIYSAVRDQGDVLGIYCGHDHINSYHGNYFGVELGYCPGTGFGPYGLNDGTWDEHTLRGARVFELNENAPRVYESTRLIFARELGVDMNPEKQPLKVPSQLPAYVDLPAV